MKGVNTRWIVPVIFIVMGLVFAIIGFTQLGFWHSVDGPMPGFFPSIMAIVMVATSIIAFLQSFKNKEKVDYKKDELLVIAGGIGIFVATFIIGLVPTIFLYVILWLKLIEKTSWKITLIILVVVAFITIGVFGMWLGVQFPMGLFESLV